MKMQATELTQNFQPHNVTIDSTHCQAQNNNQEDQRECITNFEFLQKSILKKCFYYFTLFATFGISYLAYRSNYKLQKKFYAKASANEATHVYVSFDENDSDIVELKRESVFINNNIIQKTIARIRKLKYFYCENSLTFKMVQYEVSGNPQQIYQKFLNQTQTHHDHKAMEQIFGLNLIEVEIKNVFYLFMDEVLNLYYFFQFFAIFTWMFDNYVLFSSIILLLTILSAIYTVYTMRKNLISIKEMAHHDSKVLVKKDNENFEEISSIQLLPTNIIKLTNKMISPCDLILLQGRCVVDESMLTGESLPVNKTSLMHSTITNFNSKDHKECMIFGGSCVLNVKGETYALVLNTGYSSVKGQLIHSILFPKKQVFKFYIDSFKFLGILMIGGIIGWIYTGYIVIKNQLDYSLIYWRGAELITIIFPPTLPACLTVGVQVALERLKKKKIFCIVPDKITVAGRVKVMCFDKTGTLTEDSLQLKHLIVNNPLDNEIYQNIYSNVSQIEKELFSHNDSKLIQPQFEIKKNFILGMATAQNLSYLDGQLVGDPLDQQMFKAVGWKLNESIENNNEGVQSDIIPPQDWSKNIKLTKIEVLKQFDFVPELQAMTTFVKMINNNDFLYHIFTKGSPEKIFNLCKNISKPQSYKKTVKLFAMQGFRLIALAGRKSTKEELSNQYLKRENVEDNLDFYGFLVFENSLKPASTPTVKNLQENLIQCTMITGDNPLTGICVARECFIIPRGKTVILGDIENGMIVWNKIPELPKNLFSTFSNESLSNESAHNDLFQYKLELQDYQDSLDKYQNLPLLSADVHLDLDNNLEDQSVFALTGSCLEYFYKKYFDLKRIHGELHFETKKTLDTLIFLIKHTKVYARMKPYHKVLATHLTQQYYTSDKLYVGFCGDGANDCGALKAADIGISLSDTEASIAAPFTSQIKDIKCVIRLLREGRASLTMSFQIFKYVCYYGLNQFIAACLVYFFLKDLTNMEYLTNDLFVAFPISIFLTYHGSYRKVTKYVPGDTLISWYTLLSLGGQLVLSFVAFIGGIYLYSKYSVLQSISTSTEFNNEATTINTIAFLILNILCLNYAIAVSLGKPFRKEIFTNKFLIVWLILCFVNLTISLFWPNKFYIWFFQITALEKPYRIILFAAMIGVCIISIFHDRFLLPTISKKLKKMEQKKKAVIEKVELDQTLYE